MIGTGFYVDDIDDQIAVAQQTLEEDINHIMMVFLLVGAGLVVVFGVMSIMFANNIANPLAVAAEALKGIGEGEGDLSKRLDTSVKGEVGDVAYGFNAFAAKIQLLVSEVKSVVEELSRTSHCMTSVVDETRTEVNEQRQETEQVAAAIHEMAAAVQEVSMNATNTSHSVQEADEFAQGGQKVVNETVVSIQLLQGGVNAASDVITQLDCDAEHIGTVVNVIKDIADQTNFECGY
ncbi:methyl-accepting chemotaxis protein [Neptuniibacter marinus]|uniref:methyl-accepting chemotaxis protein n=1 Tax=Neptuniibacter marinus TaxID=1806670 RepID=UPI003B5CCF09